MKRTLLALAGAFALGLAAAFLYVRPILRALLRGTDNHDRRWVTTIEEADSLKRAFEQALKGEEDDNA